MKALLAAVLVLSTLPWANAITVGGTIREIHSVACEVRQGLDFSRDGSDQPIATCVINNNLPWFQESFRFSGEGAGFFHQPGIAITALTFHGQGGVLGDGVEAPSGQNILPELRNQAFLWPGVEQRTSTRNYVVEFRASWKASKTADRQSIAEHSAASQWMTVVLASEL